jgi:hypothetical protein
MNIKTTEAPRASITIVSTIVYVCLSLTASAIGQTPPFKITAIKAMLYFEQTGTFSKDVLADPNFAFWNTIIGEGTRAARHLQRWCWWR